MRWRHAYARQCNTKAGMLSSLAIRTGVVRCGALSLHWTLGNGPDLTLTQSVWQGLAEGYACCYSWRLPQVCPCPPSLLLLRPQVEQRSGPCTSSSSSSGGAYCRGRPPPPLSCLARVNPTAAVAAGSTGARRMCRVARRRLVRSAGVRPERQGPGGWNGVRAAAGAGWYTCCWCCWRCGRIRGQPRCPWHRACGAAAAVRCVGELGAAAAGGAGPAGAGELDCTWVDIFVVGRDGTCAG